MNKNNRGLSAIVATLIIILLAIVAFGIISVVVKNTLNKGAESIELGTKCLDVDVSISKVVETSAGTYDVTVTRTATGQDIEGVLLVFTDEAGENSEVITEKIGIGPLGTKTFENVELNATIYDVLSSVSVAPYFLKESGEEHPCENQNVFTDINQA